MHTVTHSTPARTCCVCDSKLYGRSDKVFCNYTCKNKYHAALRKHNKSVASQTIGKLNRNYQILCLLIGKKADKFRIHRLELMRYGFQFDVMSGVEVNKFGLKCQVYEFSWYMTQNQQIIVSRDQNQSQISPYVYKRWEMTCNKKAGT